MSDLFGEETITMPGSPDESGQEQEDMAGDPEEQEDYEPEGDDNDADLDESEEQEEEEGAPPQDGQGEGLILGKFKTQEDLAKAYQNLQREHTKTRMQQSGGQQPPAQQQSPAQQDGQPDIQQLFWERFKTDPIGAVQAIATFAAQQQTAPIFEERRTATLAQSFETISKEYRQVQTPEGLTQLRGKVQEIATELGRPDLADNPTPRILRMAAEEAFGSTKASAYQRGKQAGRQESEQTRQSKQGLGAPGGARRQQEAEKTPEQLMKEGILEAGKGMGLFG